jgi:hypothetical protein
MKQAHVGIVLVDACHRQVRPALLIILIRDEWIRIDVAMDDFEAIFVGDAVSVPECRGWVDWAGHIMESGEANPIRNI